MSFTIPVKTSFYLEIIGHSCESPTSNHMVLPLVDVLETEERASTALKLADLEEYKSAIAFT